MGAGRPPKPSEVKRAEGNRGRRPLNVLEPEFEARTPIMPSGLPAAAQEAWNDLAALLGPKRVLTVADGVALELLCVAYARWRKLERFVEKNGRTYKAKTKDGGTMIRPRPEVAMAAEAWREVQRMCTEFGLTPSSRSRVKAAPEKQGNKVKAFLNGSQG